MKTIKMVAILVLALGLASVTLAAEGIWTEKAPMPTARTTLSASTVDGKIYAIGGYGGRSAVEQYNPVTDTWTKKASLPTPRQWLSTSAVNGKIYAIGGDARGGAPGLSTVEEYDPATDTWTEEALTPMPTARFTLSTSVVDGKIYAIGGILRATQSGPETPSSAVEAYDPETDTWTEKAPMPTARGMLSTSVVDGKIYAIGGLFYNMEPPLSTVEVYDPATDTWTTKASMPTARVTFSATSAVNGIIYVIGGASGEPAFSTVEAYDPATDTWTEKTSMPRARTGLATSVVNGKIYAIGGSPASHGANMSTVYEYDPNPLVVDFNGDGVVDCADICLMVDHWGTDEPLYDIAPRPFGDDIVDVQDMILLSAHLFEDVNDPTLVAHWALDEAEGDIAYDSITVNDAVVFGNAIWQPDGGQVRGALQLDGIDDYLTTDFVLNPIDGAFSVFAWIKGGAPGQVILSQIGAANWLLADPLQGNLMTGLEGIGRGGSELTSQMLITDESWHRVGLTWDGSNRILYADDLEVARDTQTQLGDSVEGLYIGAGKNLEPGSFFSGLIDDVRIYNRAVTP
ncbi:MAG: Kelch repeat-containing protein [Planctomycetota bacterium]|jgi:N-acetylneuraminic acid mutarotase